LIAFRSLESWQADCFSRADGQSNNAMLNLIQHMKLQITINRNNSNWYGDCQKFGASKIPFLLKDANSSTDYTICYDLANVYGMKITRLIEKDSMSKSYFFEPKENDEKPNLTGLVFSGSPEE
jgi:hypothetical protein